MKLSVIFQSIESWRRLSSITMKPMMGYAILKYTKQVIAEWEIIEEQRFTLFREITGTKENEIASIKPNTPEFEILNTKFNEILNTESDLLQLDMDFEEVVEAIGEKDGVLTIQDLASLEQFFKK